MPQEPTNEHLNGNGNGNGNGDQPELQSGELQKTIQLSDMYQNWFLDYASYVILERAVPEMMDGLKPVQRRLLHAMKELDDGRYNKVANIIGHTMKYHPHGDASIGDALVQLGQKELLIDTQGNWGNTLTGDSAAAPRYIEARLSKFALEVAFNPKTTTWKASYDGRNKEPETLPVKFPLLLAQGVEGIAVGLASKILPHNFLELIDASIKILQNKEFEIYPDFPTGGMADISRYNDGIRGGKVRLRAKIQQQDKKTLVITEIPFGTTTGSIIDSILAANDKGKIKIRKIDDNTSGSVEIIINLAAGVSPDTTIDALYAFTDCEVSISPNACVISESKPGFIGVTEMLKASTWHTVELLKMEQQIRIAELKEQLHYATLEKIFIENEVYEAIKKCKTDEDINAAILKGLKPFAKQLIRPVNEEDIRRLRKIPIERISKFNSNKADEVIAAISSEIKVAEDHLAHIVDYTIEYFRQIRKKYGKNKERKTELRSFETIEAVKVAAANQKLYVNREEGFAGTTLRKDEYVCDCSDIDDIIVFHDDGSFIVTKVAEKTYVGQGILYINVYKKNDNRTVYNLIYRDGKNGKIMVKRFSVLGITRDKEYHVTKGTPGSKVLYFTANANGEAEVVKVELKPKPRLKKSSFEFNFADIAIKGRNSIGNTLTKFAIRKIEIKQEGVSTLGSLNVWYDDTVQRLNNDGRGVLLGAFSGDNRLITFMQSGAYRLTSFDLSSHFDEDMIRIEKFNPGKIWTVVYQEAKTKLYYLKRFTAELTDRRVEFIDPDDKLILFTGAKEPGLNLQFDMKVKAKGPEEELINVAEFIGVKGSKAKGKRLTSAPVKKLEWVNAVEEPEPEPEPEVMEEPEAPELISLEPEEEMEPDTMQETGTPEETEPDAAETEPTRDVTSAPPQRQARPARGKKTPKKEEDAPDNGEQMELPL